MTLSLIRHGATDANEKRIYCGFTDIPLSESGKAGLLRLIETGKYPKADIYITSGMKRTDETMRMIYNKSPDLVMEEFKEYNFGAFEMKSHIELCGDAGYLRWIEGGCEISCTSGESRDIFENRIKSGLRRLARLEAQSAVIVCHGGVIASIMEFLFPGKRNFYEWQPGFGRGYTIDKYGFTEVPG